MGLSPSPLPPSPLSLSLFEINGIVFYHVFFQPTRINRRSPSPSIISPTLPPHVRRLSGDRVPWMGDLSGKYLCSL